MDTEWIKLVQAHTESNSSRVVAHLLKEQIDIARLQFKRVKDDQLNLKDTIEQYKVANEYYKKQKGEEYEAAWDRVILLTQQGWKNDTMLYADKQLLVTIISRIDRLFAMLQRELPHLKQLTVIRDKYQPYFKYYTDCRNDMEHIDERIDRGVLEVHALVIGRGYEFMLGYIIDVSEERERVLENFFNELLGALTN